MSKPNRNSQITNEELDILEAQEFQESVDSYKDSEIQNYLEF